MDEATAFVQYREAVRNGPFYCGDSTEPGKTVTVTNRIYKDNLKRYTDKYLTERRLGNTVETYPHFTNLLSDQLQVFIGLKKSTKPKSASSQKPKSTAINGALDNLEEGDDVEIEKDEDEVEQVEDEFEEFEDDDYNAEKYFDDGGEDGDIDDGGEPDYS